MNVFQQRVVVVHDINMMIIIKKNRVMKILVLVMDFMNALAMAMVVVVVDGVLILTSMVVDGMLIFMISVEEDVDVVVMCILMMKMMLIMTMMKDLMIMKTLLLASTMIIVEVLVMMEDIIVVVTIGMIRIALLESS